MIENSFRQKKIQLLFCLFFLQGNLFCQNFDSLWNNIQLVNDNDSLLAERYIELGYEYYYFSLDSLELVVSLADTAFQIADNANEPFIMSSALNLKAKANGDLGNYQEAITVNDLAISILKEHKAYLQAAKLEDNKANYLLENGEYDKALDLKLKSCEVFKKEKDTLAYAIGMSGIGAIYLDKGASDIAKNYLRQSFEFAQVIDHQPLSAYVSSNLAIAYHGLEELDSALYYYEFTRKNGAAFKDMHSLNEAYIGILLMDKGDYEDAIRIYQTLVSNYSKESQDLSLLYYKSLIAQAFAYQTQYDSAKFYLNQVDENIYRDRTFRQLEHLYNGYETYNHIGDYEKALAYYTLHRVLSDSLKNEKTNARFKEIETKYETEKKEAQLREKELQLIKTAQQRNILWSVVGFLFLLVLGSIVFFRQRLQTNKKLAELNATIQKNQIRKLEQEKQLVGSQNLLKGQMEERKRIAQDLHDSLGGYWTSIKAHYHSLANLNDFPKTHELHEQTEKMIEDSYEELRRISHDMMPPGFVVGGIKEALEGLSNQIGKNFDLELNFTGSVDDLDEVTGLTIYRVIQEALQNIIKHARATEVFIQFFRTNDQLHITIEDDGQGFDLTKVTENNKGLGLNHMREKVHALNGNFNLESTPGSGTLISIEIPMEHYELENTL